MSDPLKTINQPGAANTPNAPDLPGVNAPQPTAEQRAAVETQFAELRDAPKSLAKLILYINAHPELTTWAKASVGGEFQF